MGASPRASLALVTVASSSTACLALRSGAISAAGLDVTAPEPLPADSTLWDAPNLVLTPHAAGGRAVGAVDRIIANAAIVEATPTGEVPTGLEALVTH